MRAKGSGTYVALLLGAAACGESAAPAPMYTVVREDPSDLPLDGLSESWMERFTEGDARFETTFRASQGLGPLYIRASCAACHADDGKGPGFVTKMVLVEADGRTPRADQSALAYGHTVRAQRAAGATRSIEPPSRPDLLVTRRIGPAVFGRGYLEAVADSEIEALEAAQASAGGAISGRIHRVTRASETNSETRFHQQAKGQGGLIGRFGVKARVASLDDFAADAFQGDMGMSSALRPEELPNPDGLGDDEHPGVDLQLDFVNSVADYVRLIDLPARSALPEGGAALFARAQCAACHQPELRTRADYPIPQLAGIAAPIYSDLLLHDMGALLSDGLADYDAAPSEWRTAPLMGVRHLRSFLHDGRASTVDQAIRLHAGEGSEANESIQIYQALSEAERELLLAFVQAL